MDEFPAAGMDLSDDCDGDDDNDMDWSFEEDEHGGSLASVAIPGVNPAYQMFPRTGTTTKSGVIYSHVRIGRKRGARGMVVARTRAAVGAGWEDRGSRPASLSFIHVESELLPFNDYNPTCLYVKTAFCTIRFPDGGGLVL